MCDGNPATPSADDKSLAREILEGRKFTLEEAIARMAGPGALKGESPVTRLQQAQFAIEACISDHLTDAGDALRTVLTLEIANGNALIALVDRPLSAIVNHCQTILDSEYILAELTRNVDAEWGRTMGERPYFNRAGKPCHPDDPYTIENVRAKVVLLVERIVPK